MSFQPLYTETHYAYMADICTAGSVFIQAPYSGVIEKIICTPQADVTSADNIITLELDGVAASGASITVPSTGTSTGVAYTDSGSWAVTKDQMIEFVSDGAGSGTVPAMFQAIIRKVTAL